MDKQKVIKEEVSNKLTNHSFLKVLPCESYPCILLDIVSKWKASQWTIDYLATQLGASQLEFRCSSKVSENIQWEPNCEYIKLSISEFQEKELSCPEKWFYADYMHVKNSFGEFPSLIKELEWNSLGFPEDYYWNSTLWIGSTGCYTCCHYDTYGYNLVAQLCGKKRWILFPPSDTEYLYPTRIPYEDSSVFSSVNIKYPDFEKFPKFGSAHPYEVVLSPGDLLYVPRHWWHYVETIETSISANLWVDEPHLDNTERVKESLVQLLVSSFLKLGLASDIPEEFEVFGHSSYINALENQSEDEVLKHGLSLLKETCKKSYVSNNSEEEPVSKWLKFNYNLIPSTSMETLFGKNSCEKDVINKNRNCQFSVQDVINVFTHPEVIELVQKKLEHI